MRMQLGAPREDKLRKILKRPTKHTFNPRVQIGGKNQTNEMNEGRQREPCQDDSCDRRKRGASGSFIKLELRIAAQ
jgi:hypothetical protein